MGKNAGQKLARIAR